MFIYDYYYKFQAKSFITMKKALSSQQGFS